MTINNHFRHQWWSIKMPRTRWVCYSKITNLTLRSKVTNNGMRHIVWRWSTYMPNMKSLFWTTKSYSPDTICYGSRNRFDLEVKIQGQRSPTMVRDTSSGGGLPTCQIWKSCLERQKSYSLDTICYGRTDRQTDHYRASATKCRGPNNIVSLFIFIKKK